jgi:hypothetical protein
MRGVMQIHQTFLCIEGAPLAHAVGEVSIRPSTAATKTSVSRLELFSWLAIA